MSDEFFDVLEYTLHQVARGCGIVEGDVIGGLSARPNAADLQICKLG